MLIGQWSLPICIDHIANEPFDYSTTFETLDSLADVGVKKQEYPCLNVSIQKSLTV